MNINIQNLRVVPLFKINPITFKYFGLIVLKKMGNKSLLPILTIYYLLTTIILPL